MITLKHTSGKTVTITEAEYQNSQLYRNSRNWKIVSQSNAPKAEKPVATPAPKAKDEKE